MVIMVQLISHQSSIKVASYHNQVSANLNYCKIVAAATLYYDAHQCRIMATAHLRNTVMVASVG